MAIFVFMKIKTFITQAYSSLRHKSKRRGHEMPSFTKNELVNWLYQNGLERRWILYIESGFDKNVKPSIDRIDDYKGYSFENMQLITWRENLLKGTRGIKHRINASKSNAEKHSKTIFQYNKQLELIAVHKNAREASEKTNIHKVDIARVCIGDRKQSHGFYFSYVKLNKRTFKEKKHALSRPVNQMNMNGVIIKRWGGISEAATALNLHPTSISAACIGRLNKTGGFRWQYALTASDLTVSEKVN